MKVLKKSAKEILEMPKTYEPPRHCFYLSFFVAAEEEDWLLIKILMAGSGYALWASHVIFKSCGLTQPMANVVLLGGAKNRNRYSRVHKSSDSFFSKILEKPSIVQKKMILHIKGLDFSKR